MSIILFGCLSFVDHSVQWGCRHLVNDGVYGGLSRCGDVQIEHRSVAVSFDPVLCITVLSVSSIYQFIQGGPKK